MAAYSTSLTPTQRNTNSEHFTNLLKCVSKEQIGPGNDKNTMKQHLEDPSFEQDKKVYECLPLGQFC
jgi:hypothetical protein